MTGPLEKPAIRAPSTEQEQPASITFLLSSRSSNPLNNKDIPSEVIICAEEMAAINVLLMAKLCLHIQQHKLCDGHVKARIKAENVAQQNIHGQALFCRRAHS